MNQIPSLFAAVIALIILHGCGASVDSGTPDQTTSDPGDRALIDGLLGKWIDAPGDDGTIFHEQWERLDARTYRGLGFVMLGSDTVFIEHLGIHLTDTGTFYAAEIPTQNAGAPVYFRLTSANDSLVFENPRHDFPQRIVYRPSARAGWVANVTGETQGEKRSMRFDLMPREEGTRSH